MSLEVQIFHRIKDSALTNEGAWQRCELARKLEEAGDYEAAQDVLDELWPRLGERPQIQGLDRRAAGEVLLRVGVLTGWLGSAKQIQSAQETAKNLISESQAIFESLQEAQRVAEALTELAYCYWREGAFDEARASLHSALTELTDKDSHQKAVALLRLALVESTATRFGESLRILNQAAPLFEASDNHALKGKFHNELATVLKDLGEAEHRLDYTDRALVEYAASSFHFEQAGHKRYRGCVEINLGMLFFALGKFTEAHEHLDCARPLFVGLNDSGHIAQTDETRARVLLAEGRVAEAERVVREAVRVFDKGDEHSLLAEALTTHGKALARLGRYEQAHLTLQSAMERAQQAGDLEGAGQAALTLIEELAERFIPTDLAAIYERAADLLAHSQHPGLLARLCAAARKVISVITASPAPALAPAAQNAKEFRASLVEFWDGYSLQAEVHRYEQRMIALALKTAGGAVTRAATLLGIEHHQTLIAMLNTRHRNLLSERKQVITRHRSIVRGPRSTVRRAPNRETRPVTILYVEDNKLLLRTIMDTLALEGWRVEVCEDGAQALAKIESAEAFDLFLLDSNLPGLSGIELTRRARQMAHRRQTPIIMFSASRVEMAAQRAGASAFLRKPDDVNEVVKTITRLLAARNNK
jgi:CheY-like chemotaxis protein/predicted negative regulator of RcsB-dependent stress response